MKSTSGQQQLQIYKDSLSLGWTYMTGKIPPQYKYGIPYLPNNKSGKLTDCASLIARTLEILQNDEDNKELKDLKIALKSKNQWLVVSNEVKNLATLKEMRQLLWQYILSKKDYTDILLQIYKQQYPECTEQDQQSFLSAIGQCSNIQAFHPETIFWKKTDEELLKTILPHEQYLFRELILIINKEIEDLESAQQLNRKPETIWVINNSAEDAHKDDKANVGQCKMLLSDVILTLYSDLARREKQFQEQQHHSR